MADNGTKGGGDCGKKGKESLKKSAACLAYLCKFHFEGYTYWIESMISLFLNITKFLTAVFRRSPVTALEVPLSPPNNKPLNCMGRSLVSSG